MVDVEQKLWECWINGVSVVQTVIAIKRNFKIDVEREYVRKAFVKFAGHRP